MAARWIPILARKAIAVLGRSIVLMEIVIKEKKCSLEGSGYFPSIRIESEGGVATYTLIGTPVWLPFMGAAISEVFDPRSGRIVHENVHRDSPNGGRPEREDPYTKPQLQSTREKIC